MKNYAVTPILAALALKSSRCSIVVSIPACHAGDPGSIPGSGDFKFFFLGTRPPNTIYDLKNYGFNIYISQA
uniref:Uncharacterized protein n=1 Tax=Physcomitrium patens TaxID=3218 RepID=A0A2K1JGH3_PHYPA|nr:hypothetical protein PHYPA_018057 [Physcomitrium patens]